LNGLLLKENGIMAWPLSRIMDAEPAETQEDAPVRATQPQQARSYLAKLSSLNLHLPSQNTHLAAGKEGKRVACWILDRGQLTE